MKRILSLIAALIFVMSLTSVFAATADWNGYFTTQFRAKQVKPDDATQGGGLYLGYTARGKYNETYFWQKLELYPTWKLSDNVALHAGFFTQNYWGTGRLFGFQSTDPIQKDSGSFAGLTGSDPMSSSGSTEGVTLGVSSAWATLTFLDQKLGIDIGRRLNTEWGTGAFLGGKFSPDRIFLTYKESATGGLHIPYVIFEDRNNFVTTTSMYYTDKSSTQVGRTDDSLRQILFGDIFIIPGKALAGITINPNFVGKNWKSADGNTVNGDNTVFWAVDLYADYKVTINEQLTVKPIFEILYGTGKVFSKASKVAALTNGSGVAGDTVDFYADVLNFIFKAEVKLKNMATFTPEYGYVKAPKSPEVGKWYSNFWGFNQFCGSEYKIGKIFNQLNGGTNSYSYGGNALMGASKTEYPARNYIKARIDADILSSLVTKGLNFYVAGIYAFDLGYKKIGGADMKDDSKTNAFGFPAGFTPARAYNKTVVTEVDLGVSYQIDSYATISFDFAYAKWGKSYSNDGRGQGAAAAGNTSTSGIDKRGATELFFGGDLTVKF